MRSRFFPALSTTTSHNQGFRNCISCTSHKVSKTRPQTSVNLNITWRDPVITLPGSWNFCGNTCNFMVPSFNVGKSFTYNIRNKATNKHFRYTEKLPNFKKIFGNYMKKTSSVGTSCEFLGGTKCLQNVSKSLESHPSPSHQGIGHRTEDRAVIPNSSTQKKIIIGPISHSHSTFSILFFFISIATARLLPFSRKKQTWELPR